MKHLCKIMTIILIINLLMWLGGIMRDKIMLQDNIIRLHVVANSDSTQDQSNKLEVKDAVVSFLNEHMQSVQTKQEAREYLLSHTEEIECIAKETLRKLNCSDTVKISLAEEAFSTRVYDTFALPAGNYEALRIQIGSAEGQNWWCVVFPSLCIPKSTKAMSDVAASAGFDDDLTNTLTGKQGYRIRFFVLDWFGKLENLFS